MAEADTVQAEHTSAPIFIRVIGGLMVVVGLGTVLFFLVFALTFFGAWKVAIVTEILILGAAIVAWRRRLFVPWLRSVVIGTMVLAAGGTAVFLMGTWNVQAGHDARLSEMVNELCALEISAGGVEDCDGSISNTGNGNSCRYLATGIISTVPESVTSELESEGFVPTELDQWGDPMQDGRGYREQANRVQLFLQSSWQADEGDLRCT